MNLLELLLDVLMHLEALVVDGGYEVLLADTLALAFLDEDLLLLQVVVDRDQIVLHGLHHLIGGFHAFLALVELLHVVALPGERSQRLFEHSVHLLDLVRD